MQWGITSVQWGDSFSTVEGIQYSGGYLQYSGGTFSTVGGTISTVEIKIWNITDFQRISKSFISLRNQIDHIAGLKC